MIFASCGTINRFTDVHTTPREYSENYHIEGVRAPKSEVHKTPWVVYSDCAQGATVAPGGRLKSMDISFLEPLLVIDEKGGYLQLIKYKAENIKNNKFAEYKKAEYVGWVHISNLILSSTSITDVHTGQKSKLLTLLGDSTMLFNPNKYFAKADSLKVYADASLKVEYSAVGVHDVVYAIKVQSNLKSVLISKSPNYSLDDYKSQIIGWVPSIAIKNIGSRLFVNIKDLEYARQPQPLKYSPMVASYRTDSLLGFKSGIFTPIIDKSYNRVFNVDGESITYQDSKGLQDNLRHINVVLAIEHSPNVALQYPMLLNVMQNLEVSFPKTDTLFKYHFSASVMTSDGLVHVPLSSSYREFMDDLTNISKKLLGNNTKGHSIWSALRGGLNRLDVNSGRVNVVVHLGERGDGSERAPDDIVRLLQSKNCRLLGWQLYTDNSEIYNNYTLQLSDMIRRYAAYQTKSVRSIILYADQLRSTNELKELGRNHYALDYPNKSMTQGSFIFAEKGNLLPLGFFSGAIDSLLTAVKREHYTLITSFDRAFSSVGDSRDCYERPIVKGFNIPSDVAPTKEFKELNRGNSAMAYLQFDHEIPLGDGIDYRLMLSKSEVELVRQFIGSLSAKEVDKESSGSSATRGSTEICDYTQDDRDIDEIEYLLLDEKIESVGDVKYLSTRKVRRYLRDIYIAELKNHNSCSGSKCRDNRLTLAQAHTKIFGVDPNSAMLESITVKSLKRRCKVSDSELDELINYFKECKDLFEVNYTSESFTSSDEIYYYINPNILP